MRWFRTLRRAPTQATEHRKRLVLARGRQINLHGGLAGLAGLARLARSAQQHAHALKARAGGVDDVLAAFPTLAAGWLVLLILLVDETDEGFANIYSTAVSLQNYFPKANQIQLSILVGIISTLLAALIITSGVPLLDYENFLLLIGSFFVPLFGVVAADYFLHQKRRYDRDALYQAGGRYWFGGGFNWLAIGTWALGVLLYWLLTDLPQRTLAPLGLTLPPAATALPTLSQFGGTIPSFLLSFVLYARVGRKRATVPTATL